MELFPFSSQGVQDLLAQLYALSDARLAAQANAISSNFKSWIAGNFNLTTAQLIYLDSMADAATEYFGQQCAFCFNNRLQIILDYPDKPANPSYSKWSTSSNSIAVQTDGNGAFKAAGELVFSLRHT